MTKKQWSKQDKQVNKLTGFEPAERSIRSCTTCGKSGHYYYECNGGEFLNMANALCQGLSNINESR